MLGRGGKSKGGIDLAKQDNGADEREMDQLGPYPQNVSDQPSRARIIEKALRSMTIVATVSGLMNIAMIMLVITILPLQRVYPYLVTFKNQDNQVVSVEPLDVNASSLVYATEDNVRDYVVQRHKVTPNQTLMNAQWGPGSRLAARTEDTAYTQFQATSQNELKDILTQKYSRDIDINSVTRINDTLWQVNFTTIDRLASDTIPVAGVAGISSAEAAAPTNGLAVNTAPSTTAALGAISSQDSRQTWVATLRVAYQPKRITYNQRLLNPLGFTVVDYTVARRS